MRVPKNGIVQYADKNVPTILPVVALPDSKPLQDPTSLILVVVNRNIIGLIIPSATIGTTNKAPIVTVTDRAIGTDTTVSNRCTADMTKLYIQGISTVVTPATINVQETTSGRGR
jgi:hypothetical protein